MQLTLLSFPEILVSKVMKDYLVKKTVYSNEKDIGSSSNISRLKVYHVSAHILVDIILNISLGCVQGKKIKHKESK